MWKSQAARPDLEADPLRPPPGPEPSRGPVRSPPHHPARPSPSPPSRSAMRSEASGARKPRWGAAAAAFATGLVTTCFYEFVHCIQHLAYKPKRKWLAEMKKRHMAHHFHDENGNYGITTFFWDRLFGTFYDQARERPRKSPTVFNLGYTPEVAELYPHVARAVGRSGDGSSAGAGESVGRRKLRTGLRQVPESLARERPLGAWPPGPFSRRRWRRAAPPGLCGPRRPAGSRPGRNDDGRSGCRRRARFPNAPRPGCA